MVATGLSASRVMKIDGLVPQNLLRSMKLVFPLLIRGHRLRVFLTKLTRRVNLKTFDDCRQNRLQIDPGGFGPWVYRLLKSFFLEYRLFAHLKNGHGLVPELEMRSRNVPYNLMNNLLLFFNLLLI